MWELNMSQEKYISENIPSSLHFFFFFFNFWLRSLSAKFQIDSIYGSGSNKAYGNPIKLPQNNGRVILSVSKLLTKRN